MPELDFVLGSAVSRQLFELVFAQELVVVPCLRYKSCALTQLTNVEDALGVSNSSELSGPLYLVNAQFTKEPLVLRAFTWRGENRYYVRQRYGGPYLDLYPCRCKEDRKPPLVTSGFIAYYRSYYLQEGSEEMPAPDSLKSCYRSMGAWIRARCVKYTTPDVKRTYWVDPEIIMACRRGLTTNVPGLEEFALTYPADTRNKGG